MLQFRTAKSAVWARTQRVVVPVAALFGLGIDAVVFVFGVCAAKATRAARIRKIVVRGVLGGSEAFTTGQVARRVSSIRHTI